MKYTLLPLTISLLISSQSLYADINSDSEQLFNDAQQVFPQFFPSQQSTQTLEPWLFRHYPSTQVYLGVNKENLGVYLLGGTFGDTPVYVDTMQAVSTALQAQIPNQEEPETLCDVNSIPEGFSYQQNGHSITISTNGQCVSMSDIESQNYCDINPETGDDGKPVSTGIHMLSSTQLTYYNFTGFNIPGISDALLDSAVNTKTCLINAPSDFNSFSVNYDLCLDLTDQIGSEPGVAQFITPPVTLEYTGATISEQISDCFSSDADTISDAVTGELWIKSGGGFRQII